VKARMDAALADIPRVAPRGGRLYRAASHLVEIKIVGRTAQGSVVPRALSRTRPKAAVVTGKMFGVV